MTKTIRQKLIRFSQETNGGTTKWTAEDERGMFHLTDVAKINLDEWLEKQKTSGNYAEGQQLVEVVRRYQALVEGEDLGRGRKL